MVLEITHFSKGSIGSVGSSNDSKNITGNAVIIPPDEAKASVDNVEEFLELGNVVDI